MLVLSGLNAESPESLKYEESEESGRAGVSSNFKCRVWFARPHDRRGGDDDDADAIENAENRTHNDDEMR